MRRFLLLAILGMGFLPVIQAQKKVPTADQRASRQTKTLQDQLHLSSDQVTRVHMILLDRAIQVDSLRNSATGDRKSSKKALRNIMRDSDDQINSILNADQKKLYADWKQEQRSHSRRQAIIDSLHAVN